MLRMMTIIKTMMMMVMMMLRMTIIKAMMMMMVLRMTMIKTMIMMVMMINLKSEQLVDLLTNVVQVTVDPSQDVQLGKVQAYLFLQQQSLSFPITYLTWPKTIQR